MHSCVGTDKKPLGKVGDRNGCLWVQLEAFLFFHFIN